MKLFETAYVEKVFGAPGCGKTTRLMDILELEIPAVGAHNIAYVSFTKKGAYEGAERAKTKFNLGEASLEHFRTLHSMAFRAGNYSRHRIMKWRNFKEFSEAMGMHFVGYYTEEFNHNDDRYIFADYLKRNNPVAFEDFIESLDYRIFESIELNYREYRRHTKVADFTDMIETFIERQDKIPVKVAIIDEAQDLTSLQWNMVKCAFSGCERIYIAGDDDQAIYEWSGAAVDQFLNIESDKDVILDQSYRVPKGIIDFAKNISAAISNRVDKQYSPTNVEGRILFYNDMSELKLNKNQTYYFLSRNNFFLTGYEKMLKQECVVYTRKDVLSVSAPIIECINMYERARKESNPELTQSEEFRIKKHLKNSLNMSESWYENCKLDNDEILYYRDLIKNNTPIRKNMKYHHVNTIHGVKGGEADNVVLMLDCTRSVYEALDRYPDSELRCLYVACTRAKKNLHIIHSQGEYGFDDTIKRITNG